MFYLSKLLRALENDAELFKNPDVNYILGLTASEVKNAKKEALNQQLIFQEKQKYYLTESGKGYLTSNPPQSWCCSEFPKRPEVNLEYLKQEKTPATVTKGIRNLARHLLEGYMLKAHSIEEYLKKELLDDSSAFKELQKEIKEDIMSGDKVNLSAIYNKYISYGLTKSIVSILLLGILSEVKDSVAIYEKHQFQLNLNQLLFDKIMFAPDNFELQKTVLEHSLLVERMSEIILKNKNYNILNLTKGLINFIRNLDKYTLQTEKLSFKTIKFRNAIINAKDPMTLVKKDIPKFIHGAELEKCDESFIDSFKAVVEELQNARQKMTEDIYTFTLKAFDSESRTVLAEKFKKVAEYIGSKEMKILYSNIINTDVSDKFWIERIATYINKSRVPKDWNDEDVADYKVKIKDLALRFKTLESSVGTATLILSIEADDLLHKLLNLPKMEQNLLIRKFINI